MISITSYPQNSHTNATPQRTADRIATKTNLSTPNQAPRRLTRLRHSILALLILPVLTTAAWPQQGESTLPEAPQASAEIQTSANAAPDPIPRGTIRGSVTDRDGTAYQGVRITLNQTSSAEKSTTTDDSGHFQFSGVPAGQFEITATSSGFATKRTSGTLHPGESLDLPPIVLLVTTATSDVEVTASRMEVAQAQMKDEEKQRVLGAIPNFYVVYAPNAPPLSPRQKFHLAWRTAIDPVTILAVGATAGIEQANNDFREYGQGADGYAKRFAVNYADNFIGNMIGGALFPAVFKQDPRYFYKGTGTVRERALYAIRSAVICKGDNGHWQFNYSGILGGLAAGGIASLYYPDSERNGATLTLKNTSIGIGFGAVGNLFQEFLVRKLTPKIPDYTPSKP